VDITISSVTSRFAADGDPATVVAAFRAWLAEPTRIVAPLAVDGAALDTLDRQAGTVREAEEVIVAAAVDILTKAPSALRGEQAPPTTPIPSAPPPAASPQGARADSRPVLHGYAARRDVADLVVLRYVSLGATSVREILTAAPANGLAADAAKRAIERLVESGHVEKIGKTIGQKVLITDAGRDRLKDDRRMTPPSEAPTGLVRDTENLISARSPMPPVPSRAAFAETVAKAFDVPVERIYSREEFERDQKGQTGDDIATRSSKSEVRSSKAKPGKSAPATAALSLAARRAAVRVSCCRVLNDGKRYPFQTMMEASVSDTDGVMFDDVKAVLTDLVRELKLGVSSVGVERRYQRRGDGVLA
jgi:hypothetical protein